jgi:hypothetical protein
MRVIYHGFSDQNRCLIVDKLHDQYNWNPVMMLGLDGESNQIKSWSNKFTNLVLLDSMKLRTADFDYSYIGEYTPIDREIIDKLSQYESSYLDNLDDVTGWEFSFTERRGFYHKMLKYMNSILHNFRPDLVVFSGWPHTPTCVALYYLCKHYFNIDVIFIDDMPLFDSRYHFVGNSVEELHLPFMNTYESNDKVLMDPGVLKYLEDLRNVNGKVPGYIVEDYIDSKAVPLLLIKQLLALTVKVFLNRLSDHEKLIEWKKNRKRFDLKSSRLGSFEYLFFKLGLIIKNKLLYRSYKSLCSKVDLSQKYIYFAASYQPEATTLHSSRSHEDVSLVLDMLSKYAPKGWVIYYKEHPYTFVHNSLSTLSKRNKAIYENLAQYPNVKLISPYEKNFDLISQSQVVASIAGTSTWEAAVRGIPSMCFGSVWYKGCKSIFSINNVQNLQDAFKDISNGYIPDSKDIERYAASVAYTSVKGMLKDRFEKKINLALNKEEEIDRIAVAIHDAYNKFKIKQG